MQYFKKGIILKRMKGFYYVEVEGSVHLCRIKGNLFQHSSHSKGAVGDQVQVDLEASEDAGWIHEVLPRKTVLSRSDERSIEHVLVANADILLIVTAIQDPPFRPGLVDRFLVMAQKGGLQPILVLNKTDLGLPSKILEIKACYENLECLVFPTSVNRSEGLEALKNKILGKTSVLAGHSGVGKSSLLKALFPQWNVRIGAVSEGTGKGQHTTTLAEMHPLPGGGYLVDTPGIRTLEPHGVSSAELDSFFVEFEPYLGKCRFKSCSHRHEPECCIKEAVTEGKIHPLRYRSYCDLWESNQPTSSTKSPAPHKRAHPQKPSNRRR